MTSSSKYSAVIIGATGGIGNAFADVLEDEDTYAKVWRFGRSLRGEAYLDVTDPQSIADAAARVAKGPAPALVFVATGYFGDAFKGPEKAIGDLEAATIAQQFAVNAMGPALVAQAFLPLLPRAGSPIFAALTARVGSISENRQGGWHGYRASKAALNMLLRNIAVDATRQYERSIVVGLHPGTVDTPNSEAFRTTTLAGRLFDPERAAMQLLDVLDGLKPADSGKVIAWDGSEIPA